ncbi:unnamed protein product [Adineta ricciae]|uniref:Uncharacterized protein n=1 Tax=Adineta ricciae TaxID=249248 RepID=A0A814FSF3_ADIRI|nr:unnamed protein product [Adineta ricciae]
MVESESKSRLSKILLILTCVFCGITIVCFAVGISLFFDQYFKVKSYKEDSCQVKSATYESNSKCIRDSGRKTMYYKCYIPIWNIQIGQNQTFLYNIRGNAESVLEHVLKQQDRFQVNSVYPCWYNTKNLSEVTWYRPTTYYSFILLIISAIFLPFSIVSLILFCKFRQRPDL